ncbi:class I SAM-dependent methyltransferase [Hoeflea prorocentri]|uniref:Class I SAM-dependent methyltransferase n=1 Tax=Hoeflea prorocentri TaxID=1922333 RepID=A0A9X3UIE4_9HYPH|nr:class I SAM-dependent methyltransferase [Hoeflea prorocentri]MCY6381385.1 class I SAM-dependent methyltransferase [Hoeflea prorocentri]MDA5399185.1 class I SAM-dependent methyltransferase [Hoeflea prorocentri]
MDEMDLLIDLHKPAFRQGPGGDAETKRAISLSGLSGRPGLKIADIGCGTGASTIALAKSLKADITAVDFLPDFLSELEKRADAAGVLQHITTLAASMDGLSFEPSSLDAIWSEGAIYNIGFENGIRSWRSFLKPGGILAVSELTWLTQERPAELNEHWSREYPEVATASTKIAQLEANGYTPIGYFVLPEHCWLDNYYRPMQENLKALLEKYDRSEMARSFVAAEQREIDLYEQYAAFVSYGFFIARRLPD